MFGPNKDGLPQKIKSGLTLPDMTINSRNVQNPYSQSSHDQVLQMSNKSLMQIERQQQRTMQDKDNQRLLKCQNDLYSMPDELNFESDNEMNFHRQKKSKSNQAESTNQVRANFIPNELARQCNDDHNSAQPFFVDPLPQKRTSSQNQERMHGINDNQMVVDRTDLNNYEQAEIHEYEYNPSRKQIKPINMKDFGTKVMQRHSSCSDKRKEPQKYRAASDELIQQAKFGQNNGFLVNQAPYLGSNTHQIALQDQNDLNMNYAPQTAVLAQDVYNAGASQIQKMGKNTRKTQESTKLKEIILHCQFNQDSTCLAISTNHGFKIFSLSHPEKIVKLYETTDIGIVSLIEMQFRSNIIALVLSKAKTPSAKNHDRELSSQRFNSMIPSQFSSIPPNVASNAYLDYQGQRQRTQEDQFEADAKDRFQSHRAFKTEQMQRMYDQSNPNKIAQNEYISFSANQNAASTAEGQKETNNFEKLQDLIERKKQILRNQTIQRIYQFSLQNTQNQSPKPRHYNNEVANSTNYDAVGYNPTQQEATRMAEHDLNMILQQRKMQDMMQDAGIQATSSPKTHQAQSFLQNRVYSDLIHRNQIQEQQIANNHREQSVKVQSTNDEQQQRERQRKLIIYDTKQHKAALEINFFSKIIKLEMNHSHLYVASRDHIFIFSLKEMQQIALIKAPNHLLRIAMSPNFSQNITTPQAQATRTANGFLSLNTKQQEHGKFPYIAYSEMLNNGNIQLFNTYRDQFYCNYYKQKRVKSSSSQREHASKFSGQNQSAQQRKQDRLFTNSYHKHSSQNQMKGKTIFSSQESSPEVSPDSALGKSGVNGLTQLMADKKFPIAKMKFNLEGNLIAVASSHEVALNVFSTINGCKIAQLQPKLKQNVLNSVQDMSFCPVTGGRFICCLLQQNKVMKTNQGKLIHPEESKELYIQVFDISSQLDQFNLNIALNQSKRKKIVAQKQTKRLKTQLQLEKQSIERLINETKNMNQNIHDPLSPISASKPSPQISQNQQAINKQNSSNVNIQHYEQSNQNEHQNFVSPQISGNLHQVQSQRRRQLIEAKGRTSNPFNNIHDNSPLSDNNRQQFDSQHQKGQVEMSQLQKDQQSNSEWSIVNQEMSHSEMNQRQQATPTSASNGIWSKFLSVFRSNDNQGEGNSQSNYKVAQIKPIVSVKLFNENSDTRASQTTSKKASQVQQNALHKQKHKKSKGKVQAKCTIRMDLPNARVQENREAGQNVEDQKTIISGRIHVIDERGKYSSIRIKLSTPDLQTPDGDHGTYPRVKNTLQYSPKPARQLRVSGSGDTQDQLTYQPFNFAKSFNQFSAEVFYEGQKCNQRLV